MERNIKFLIKFGENKIQISHPVQGPLESYSWARPGSMNTRLGALVLQWDHFVSSSQCLRPLVMSGDIFDCHFRKSRLLISSE